MNECQVCGEPVPEGETRCPNGHNQLATCALCGTERARDIGICPNCGSAWLDYPYRAPEAGDTTPEPIRYPRMSEADLTAAAMHQPWRPAAEDVVEALADLDDLRHAIVVRNPQRWWQMGRYAAIAIVAVGLVAAVSYAFGELGTDPTIPTVAAITLSRETTTTPPAAQPQVSVAATSATAPTTTPSTTTTLLVTPVGDAIPVNDLRLTIYGIGDLKIGDPEDQVAGALTATFGQPDAEVPVEPALAHPGACPGSASMAMRWGILEITLNDGLFAGYRLDMSLGDSDSPTAALRTASGLRVGASVSTLETIYQTYAVVYGETPGFGPTYSLQRSNGEELLWGPLSAHDGVVLGIYSQSGCD